MISKESGTDGTSSHHETSRIGSVCTVRVGSRSLPLYPLVIACLGLLNTILILSAIVIGIYCGNFREDSSPHLVTAKALIVEVKQLQLMHTEAVQAQDLAKQALIKEVQRSRQLKLQLEQNKTFTDGLQIQLEALHVEKAALQADSSHIRESCGRCLPGWFLFNASCYYHSKFASNPTGTWHESRADCISRGANLTVIDNWEEQQNLFEFLPKLSPSIRPWWGTSGGIWFGLTDIETEGRWAWINNVTMTKGYWIPGEPNEHGLEGEDCAAFLNIKKPEETWFDAGCLQTKEWLCEMEPN